LFLLQGQLKTGKDDDRNLSAEFWLRLTILKDSDFKKNKGCVKSEIKATQATWTGKRSKATTALTDDEIETLFDKKLHGLSSPQALLNTVWLHNTIHFGHRGCKEQKQLGKE